MPCLFMLNHALGIKPFQTFRTPSIHSVTPGKKVIFKLFSNLHTNSRHELTMKLVGFALLPDVNLRAVAINGRSKIFPLHILENLSPAFSTLVDSSFLL